MKWLLSMDAWRRTPAKTIHNHLDEALCLGVTVLTGPPIRDAIRVCRAAKAQRPEIPVVWGGWHPSLFPLECLSEASVDITVQGQGEETFRRSSIVWRKGDGRMR